MIKHIKHSCASSNVSAVLLLVTLSLVAVLELHVASTLRVTGRPIGHAALRVERAVQSIHRDFGDLRDSLAASDAALDLLAERAKTVHEKALISTVEGITARMLPQAAILVNTTRNAVVSVIGQTLSTIGQSSRAFPADFLAAASQRQSVPQPQDAARRQQVFADIEGEYPSEAVEEIPGPHYIHPPDALVDLPVREQDRKRAETVVDAFRHSWKGYVTYAYGMDELQPRSRTGKNWNEQEGPHNGLALTVLDSLTTMFVMGLEKELDDALGFVKTRLSFSRDVEGSTFESTIRMLGSLLSIYELTGERDQRLLELAVDVGGRIMWAYNTSTGLPHSTVGFASKRHFNQQWIGGSAVLSEFGTAQLELRTLSFHTKDPSYDIKATHVMDIIESKCPDDMLCPCYLNMRTAQWTTDHVSLGALGDSFYEYVLKQYLLTGKTEKRYRTMFLKLIRGIIDKLLFRSYPSGWAYVAEYRRGEYYHKMDHLACFVGGMLALGAMEVTGLKKDALLQLAGELTETCVRMYTRQKSGVSPEYVEFPSQQDFINGPGYYILRPETMESLFYMWRFTKDRKWRDYGWNIFRAIDRWCRVDTGGYSGLKEVNVKQPIKDNLMQSFWMAETLKYAYLLFADDEALDLSLWVMNTEAHPLRRRARDPLDVWRSYEAVHGRVNHLPPDVAGVLKHTETEGMSKLRKDHTGPLVALQDSFGEDLIDGPVDDDGNPFDPLHGPRGLPKHPGSGVSDQFVEDWALHS